VDAITNYNKKVEEGKDQSNKPSPEPKEEAEELQMAASLNKKSRYL